MTGNEFDLINRYFKSQPVFRHDVDLGIGDDAAVISVPENCQLVVTTDSLVAGNHFLPDADPLFVAHKALASNLSDLAAMGAMPAWCSLALTLPEPNESWLTAFCEGFYKLAEHYQVQLVGGDTTKGPLSITITLQGFVPTGKAIRRDGAKVGDWIYVTGNLGDSAAGLEVILRDNLPKNELENVLLHRHYYTEPRVLAGQVLRDIASSALDISDGFVADIKHILNASGVSAVINADAMPVSDELIAFTGSKEAAAKMALCSGEEYELCFTVPESHRGALDAAFLHANTSVTCIGQIRHGSGLTVQWDGNPVDWTLAGWDHFSE